MEIRYGLSSASACERANSVCKLTKCSHYTRSANVFKQF